MKDHYPRTVAEFVDTGRLVLIDCEDCRRKAPVDLSVLELTFGGRLRHVRLDARATPPSVVPKLRIAPRVVSFYDPHQDVFAVVSFEESTTRTLEFNAYSRARAAS